MAEDSFQEKTEDATPRRIAKAREEGNVPKSVEFNSVFLLLFGLMTLSFMGSSLFANLRHGFELFYQNISSISINHESIQQYLRLGINSFLQLLGPFTAVLAFVAIATNVAQVGFLFATKKLQPKFSQLNPIKGMKKFVSPKSMVELVKGFIKLGIVGSIAYYTLMSYQDDYLKLLNADIMGILTFITSIMFEVGIRIVGALFVLAILDLLYQRWQYKRDLRMSKSDIKEEQKQAEGDPLVKGAIRSMQQQRARQRMMDKVAEADVVITNPTRLAIALKYDTETMNAPVVLAKGARLLAQRIRDIARENNIPTYENKPLARSLYKIGRIGHEIPAELFQAVAEVFAHIYQLKNRTN